MSVIGSTRNSAILAFVVVCVTGCPDPGKPGEYNQVTAPNAETHDVYFPIAQGDHAVDCNTCHGEFDSFTQWSCLTGCHAATKTDGDHGNMPGYEYTSSACYACHPRGTAEGIDHSTFFPIASTDTHGGIACSTCHTNPNDRKDISCTGPGCHENPKTDGDHTGVDGYEYVSKSCYSCHPDGKVGIGDHSPYFPIDTAATHTGIGCSTCHATPTNRKDVSCAASGACHPAGATSTEHGVVGGYSFSSPLCLRCHADSQVDPVATHKPFNISSGSHGKRSCIVCHPGFRSDKPWGADFASLDCFAGCHDPGETNGHHQEVSGYQADSMSCIKSGCHPTGRAP